MMDGDSFIAGLQAEEGCCRLVLDDTELKIETVESAAASGPDRVGNCASGWTKEDTMSYYSSVVLEIPDKPLHENISDVALCGIGYNCWGRTGAEKLLR